MDLKEEGPGISLTPESSRQACAGRKGCRTEGAGSDSAPSVTSQVLRTPNPEGKEGLSGHLAALLTVTISLHLPQRPVG